MGDKTGIEWTDATWNPLRGCTRVSEGCRNCYAETVAARFSDPGQPYHGVAERGRPGSKWTGEVVLVEHLLDQPLRWKRSRKIFVNSMSDLFHEKVSFAVIDRIFAVMERAAQHTFQILTKRAARMRGYTLDRQKRGLPILKNVWLGVSVENQAAADERIPMLIQTRAAKRFLSVEPLLGATRISTIYHGLEIIKPLAGVTWYPTPPDWPTQGITARHSPAIDWVIVGGESGPGARPMRSEWARQIRDECAAASVTFFFKQWGEWLPEDQLRHLSHLPPWIDTRGIQPDAWRIGKKAAGALLDGLEHKAFPLT